MTKSDDDLEAELRWWQDTALKLRERGISLVFAEDSAYAELARATTNQVDGFPGPTYSVTVETVEGPVQVRPCSHYEKLRDQVRKQKLIVERECRFTGRF